MTVFSRSTSLPLASSSAQCSSATPARRSEKQRFWVEGGWFGHVSRVPPEKTTKDGGGRMLKGLLLQGRPYAKIGCSSSGAVGTHSRSLFWTCCLSSAICFSKFLQRATCACGWKEGRRSGEETEWDRGESRKAAAALPVSSSSGCCRAGSTGHRRRRRRCKQMSAAGTHCRQERQWGSSARGCVPSCPAARAPHCHTCVAASRLITSALSSAISFSMSRIRRCWI